MPRKNSYITVTDQFCGAGGSSQGVRNLSTKYKGGLEVKLALNHWKLAIETHNTNFPNTIHDCTDISASDPRRYGSTDILITSPECTNHSLANGKKKPSKQIDMFDCMELDAGAERSRATMWDVPRFAEYHNYNIIIVENVVDARKWIMFESWLHAMTALGYEHKSIYRNSMHHYPTPQSRDRMYVVFWKKGNKKPDLNYYPAAWCPKCEKDIASVQSWKPKQKTFKYRTGYVYCCPHCSTIVEPYYYASMNCIDWTNPGKRIGDRTKPLSPNTIRRIKYGLDKYGTQPLSVVNYTPGYCKPMTMPTGTLKTVDSHGFLTPFIINNQQQTGIGFRVKGVDEVIPTIPTSQHFNIVMPFIIKLEHGINNNNVRRSDESLATHTTRQSQMLVRPANEPVFTQTTCQGMGFAVPLVVENKGIGRSKPAINPAACITSNNYLGLVTSDAWNSFISSYYNGSHCTKHISQELGSVTTDDRHALVNYVVPQIEDCYYRMFTPQEAKLAMAFDREYVVLGNGRDQVRQCGNAVTPPVMEWIVEQCVKSLN